MVCVRCYSSMSRPYKNNAYNGWQLALQLSFSFDRRDKTRRQVSSMIHSTRPTVTSVPNIVFAWKMFCFEKWRRTDGRTNARLVQKQWSLPAVTVGRPSGSIMLGNWRYSYVFLWHWWPPFCSSKVMHAHLAKMRPPLSIVLHTRYWSTWPTLRLMGSSDHNFYICLSVLPHFQKTKQI